MTSSLPITPQRFRPESIVVIGVSATTADGAGGRELALGPDDVVRVSDRIASTVPHLESVVVATCDRTELVLGSEHPHGVNVAQALDVWHGALGIEFTGAPSPCLAAAAHPFVLDGRSAVEHLLRVACGLESSLLGDADILGQLRRAWHAAEATGTAGPVTRAVFRDAFALGRRARAQTDISAGGAGVGSAVASLASMRSGPVLIIGAGPAGTTIARRLAKETQGEITITNRTIAHAETLASEIGARTVDMAALDTALLRSEVVVSAVSSPTPILTSGRLSGLRHLQPDWTPMIIDVGAPANVEPTDAFDIVGLDGLARRHAAVSDRRCAAIPLVEQLIADVLGRRYDLRLAHPSTTVAHHHADPVSAVSAQRSSLPCVF